MAFRRSRETIERHRVLLADRERTERYERAISAVVRAGDTVVDLGCGTGVLSFLACRAGARRVYAIEFDDVIELARRLCSANGFEDRVVFLEDVSTRVELPERVDVVVTETLWNIGIGEGLLGSVADARRRFLRAGGTLVPRFLELSAAPVECPAGYEPLEIWSEGLYRLDLSAARPYAVNNVYTRDLDGAGLLAPPQAFSHVDLTEVEEVDVAGQVAFTVSRDGTLHGIGGWFAAELAPGMWLSNAPPNQVPSWDHAFFPIERPIQVRKGDLLRVALRSLQEGLTWRWEVEQRPVDSGEPVRLDQSSVRGFLLSTDDIRRARSDYTPRLSRLGEAMHFALGVADGSHSVETIAEEVLRRYPDAVPTREDAGRLVRSLVARFA